MNKSLADQWVPPTSPPPPPACLQNPLCPLFSARGAFTESWLLVQGYVAQAADTVKGYAQAATDKVQQMTQGSTTHTGKPSSCCGTQADLPTLAIGLKSQLLPNTSLQTNLPKLSACTRLTSNEGAANPSLGFCLATLSFRITIPVDPMNFFP